MSSSQQKTIDLQLLLSACLDLGRQSGDIVRAVFASGDLKAVDKAADGAAAGSQEELSDPQTIADIRSQKLIIGSLQSLFPGINVVGEEGSLQIEAKDVVQPKTDLLNAYTFPQHYKTLPLADVVVWIDPLDGTKEYTKGIVEAVTILVGISVKGKAVAGVIDIPFVKRTLWGAIGLGVFGDLSPESPLLQKQQQQKQQSSTPASPQKPTSPPTPSSPAPASASSSSSTPASAKPRRWIVTSQSHVTERLAKLVSGLGADKVINVGGAGNKGVMILDGKADAYVFPQHGTKRWDTCAVDALIHAGGGQASTSYGEPINYDPSLPVENMDGFLATLHSHSTFVLPKQEATAAYFHHQKSTPASPAKK